MVYQLISDPGIPAWTPLFPDLALTHWNGWKGYVLANISIHFTGVLLKSYGLGGG
jgi:hypothetical protein